MIIPVNLDKRTYNVCIDEKDIFTAKLKEMFPKNNFLLVTNETLAKVYAQKLDQWKQALPLREYIIGDGEKYKSVDTWKDILDHMLETRLDRSIVLIAFGGGVVGDLTGFVASTFLRGVDYVQIPTTILAMVDSSVGGKTGVNHVMGKNLIGTFYQPKLVWINTRVIHTLPPREFIAGYAEVFKTAFIGGREMFDFILANHDKIVCKDLNALTTAIKYCVEIKSRIVSEDEHESGKRALLNFGHTFGHALENYYQYRGIMHGEAVFWGITCAVDLGKRIGLIKESDYQHYDDILKKQKLPTLHIKPDINKMYTSMFSDKKVLAGKLRFILPSQPGTSLVTSQVEEKDILATLKEVFS